MSALSPILRSLEGGMVAFWCPGCDEAHAIPVSTGPKEAGRWGYNGNPDHPTFSPSILVTGTRPITDAEHARIMAGEKITPEPQRCHSFVCDGQIQFLGDCTHKLAGQTVPLPEWAE